MAPGGELPRLRGAAGGDQGRDQGGDARPLTRRRPGTLKARRFSADVPESRRTRRCRSDRRRPRPLRQGRTPGGLHVDCPPGFLAGVETRPADVPQPDRRRGRRSGRRIMAGGHADDARRHRAGCGIPPSCWWPGPVPIDRDATVAGIPLFAQLAGQLAERDFVVPALRQARRRQERRANRAASTLDDYADDAHRHDGKVAGQAQGRRLGTHLRRRAIARVPSVAMLAAAREKKIAGLVLMAVYGHDRAQS